jgi:hypothetical protein
MKFWMIWAFDALILLVFLYFFLIGLLDGTVSTRNLGMWLLILGFLVALLAGTWALQQRGHTLAALLISLIPAIPGLLYLLFILYALIARPRWN